MHQSHCLHSNALLAARWVSTLGMALFISNCAHDAQPVAEAGLCHPGALDGFDMPLADATGPLGDDFCGLNKNGAVLVVYFP